MLKLKKKFPRPFSPFNNMIILQYFSTLFKEFDPAVFDVLIQDLDDQKLKSENLSKLLGKIYLNPLKENQKEFEEIRRGIIYGSGRGLITIPTKSRKQLIWVHYLIDTGAPFTFLSKAALKALNFDETQNKFSVYINKSPVQVRHSSYHFLEINILGMDFLENQKQLNYDMQDKIITLTAKKISDE